MISTGRRKKAKVLEERNFAGREGGAPWCKASAGFGELGLDSLDLSLRGWWRIRPDFNLNTLRKFGSKGLFEQML